MKQIHQINPSHQIMPWALALLSGCLNGIGFIFVGAFVLFANVPLLIALSTLKSSSAHQSSSVPKSSVAIKLGAIVGFLGGIHIYGVLNYGWWIFWAFSLYTASQMMIYAFFFHLLWGKRSSLRYQFYEFFLPAVLWTITEWIRTIGPIALPASYVGCMSDLDWFRPWLSWAYHFGGLGVSFLIAICQSLIFSVIHLIISRFQEDRFQEDRFQENRPKRSWLPIITGFLILMLSGLWGYLDPIPLKSHDSQQPITVGAVQVGFSNLNYQASAMDPLIAQEIVRSIAKRLQEAYAQKISIVFLAETVLRGPLLEEESYYSQIFPKADQKTTLIAGFLKKDNKGKMYNLAIAVEKGQVVDQYAKVRPVPGTESNIIAGQSWQALDTQFAKVAILICFESIYPQAGRAVNEDHPALMAVLSNDAGFGYSPISKHMNNRSIERAVESGKWLVRIGQSGVSAIISPRGEITKQLDLFESANLYGEVFLKTEKSPFIRLGLWWLPLLFIFLIIGLLVKKNTPISQI
jgi:apolipoprotein N-acyltransferase